MNLNKRKIEKPQGWDLGLGACEVITWLKRGWISYLVKMDQWSFGQWGLGWHDRSLEFSMALLESSWSIEKSDDEQTRLGFHWIDPSTIGLDSCGPLSNDLGLLTVFVKQALLSILSTILLHVLRLISSMDREFQTWALFHKIPWVNHCVSLKVSIPINWLINPRTFM